MGWTIWVVIIIHHHRLRLNIASVGMITMEMKLTLNSHFFGTFKGIDSNFGKFYPRFQV
jgi:hypothetical protein